MKSYFVTFRSVTYAQRGERLLRDAGIHTALRRAPRYMEERGCGYSLSLRQADVVTALKLMRQAQLPFRKVYLKESDGNMEEVSL